MVTENTWFQIRLQFLGAKYVWWNLNKYKRRKKRYDSDQEDGGYILKGFFPSGFVTVIRLIV